MPPLFQSTYLKFVGFPTTSKALYSSKKLVIQDIFEVRLSSTLIDAGLPILFQQFLCDPAIGFHTQQ